MNIARVMGIFVFSLFMIMSTFVVFAEEVVVSSSNDVAVAVASTLESPANTQGDTQWVWGEVINLDTQANAFTLKYLDYENDQEKELVLVVDENTAYEGMKSFDELKIKDTLSIDYKITLDGKNFAKSISFEKPDDLSADLRNSAAGNVQVNVSSQTTTPVKEQPMTQSKTAVETSVAVDGESVSVNANGASVLVNPDEVSVSVN